MTTLTARPIVKRSRRSGATERVEVTVYDRDLYRRIIVDNFAGFGGAGHGIERAAGRPVDVAINHCPLAIEYHAKNSPGTLHLCSSVWEVDPDDATGGRGVALAWFSPDCRHFSRAKGKPKVDKRVRSLAWVVIKWAKVKQPDVIILENVREFETWGPLIEVDGPHGKHTVPDPDRKGETFRSWWRSLERAGYAVEKRVLNAADFGAPTIRKRLFIIARRDGKPIRWPEATHGRGEVQGGNGSGSVRTRSGADGCGLSAPHAPHADHAVDGAGRGDASRRGRGSRDGASPGVAQEARGPDRAVGGGTTADRTAGAVPGVQRNHAAPLKPYRTAAECIDWSLPVRSIFERPKPLAEKTQRRIAMGIWRYLINSDRPYLVRVNHGGDHFRGQSIEQPLATVTRQHGYGLVVPTLVSGYGEAPGQEPRAREVDRPMATVPASGKHALAATMLVRHCQNGSKGKGCTGVDEPIGVVTSQGNKFGLVYAFLMKYYSCGENVAGLDQPLSTVTTKDRVGLVMVTVERPDGVTEPAAGVWLKGPDDAERQLYLIADIGLRMLAPRELARAQGFPDSFVLPPQASKAVRLIGNSVPPPLAEAIVRANFPEGVP